MKAYLSRRYRISASHRLHSDRYSDRENELAYGKCNNPYGHGHNYTIQLTMGGPVDPLTGMVCNLADLDAFVKTHVTERFDRKNLNFDPLFQSLVPTTENLCKIIYGLIAEKFGPAQLVRVRVEETRNNFFEFAGDQSEKTENGWY